MIINDKSGTLIKKTLLNGFNIKFSIKESILLVEAENTSTSKLYLSTINENQLSILTGKLFSDVDSFYESLFDKTDSFIKLDITQNAVLNCSIETLLGKNKKTFEFSIILKEFELNPILQASVQKLKKKINLKNQTIYNLKQENENLINLINRQSLESEKQMEIRLASIIEKHSILLESKITSEIEKQFKIILESEIKNQTLVLETRIATEIEKQNINYKVIKENENDFYIKLGLQLEKTTQNIESKLEQIEKCSKTLEKKLSQIEKLEANPGIQMIKQPQILEDRVAEENNINSVHASELEIQNFDNEGLMKFDDKSYKSYKFIFSNNNQTITCKVSGWSTINLNKQLPKNKISLNFKIEKSIDSGIMIGICPFSTLTQTGDSINSMGAYAYYGFGSGYIFYKSTSIESNGGPFKVGSVITMTVDLTVYSIEWMQDNKMMHRMSLDKSFVNQEMYPCVHLAIKDDCVSLLNN